MLQLTKLSKPDQANVNVSVIRSRRLTLFESSQKEHNICTVIGFPVIRERVLTIRNWKITRHDLANSWNSFEESSFIAQWIVSIPIFIPRNVSARYGYIIAMMQLRRSRRLPRINECKIGQRSRSSSGFFYAKIESPSPTTLWHRTFHKKFPSLNIFIIQSTMSSFFLIRDTK